jgi:predicted nucleic acid-binding protein
VNYFFDSSALVKLYHPELGSPGVEAAFHKANRRIVISRLAGVELHSALSLKTRTGRLAMAEAILLRTRFLADVAAGAIVVVAIDESHYSIAENLIVQYGGRIGLRTLDALQLAVALEINRRAGLDGFLVADLALAEVAKAEGLVVMNPEQP